MSTITRAMLASITMLFLYGGIGVGHATSFPVLGFEERLERASDVFVGSVTNVSSERRGDDPWTIVSITIDEWFLHDGTLTEMGPFEVDLAFLGGSATGTAPRQVAGFPVFAVGERVLVASYGAESIAASPLVGVTQGLWREVNGVWRGDDGEALVVDATGRVDLARDGDPDVDAMPALRTLLRELRGSP